MDLNLLLLRGFYALCGCFGCVFLYKRWRWRRRKKLGRSSPGFYPKSTSLGNALQQLQVLVDPQVAYVVQERLDEEAEDDDEAGPDDPVRHLHRQAARIRRGEKLDRLTVMLPRRE